MLLELTFAYFMWLPISLGISISLRGILVDALRFRNQPLHTEVTIAYAYGP